MQDQCLAQQLFGSESRWRWLRAAAATATATAVVWHSAPSQPLPLSNFPRFAGAVVCDANHWVSIPPAGAGNNPMVLLQPGRAPASPPSKRRRWGLLLLLLLLAGPGGFSHPTSSNPSTSRQDPGLGWKTPHPRPPWRASGWLAISSNPEKRQSTYLSTRLL